MCNLYRLTMAPAEIARLFGARSAAGANFAAEVRLVALPNDVGTDRRGEVDAFDASELGGTAVPEGEAR